MRVTMARLIPIAIRQQNNHSAIQTQASFVAHLFEGDHVLVQQVTVIF